VDLVPNDILAGPALVADLRRQLAACRTERDEALAQQAASAEILQVINRSSGDLASALDVILEKATRICEAKLGIAYCFDGGVFRVEAVRDATPAHIEYLRREPPRPDPKNALGHLLQAKQPIHIADIKAEPTYTEREPARVATVEIAGARTYLAVPMLKEDRLIGAIAICRQEVRPFSDGQIEMAQTFANHAAIAIENTRLLTELRERTHDLKESLDYQTATSDVLKVISRSTFDLQPVLDTLIETASRLSDGPTAGLAVRQRGIYRYVATTGMTPELDAAVRSRSFVSGSGSMVPRVLSERRVVHIADVTVDPDYNFAEVVSLGVRTLLGVPMLREGDVVGVITVSRDRMKPFTERQIELVRTFADQAVIAIENTRLLNELRERTDELARREAELSVTFDNMGDGVAMFDAELQLAAWNRNFQHILDLPDDVLATRLSFERYFRWLAARGEFGAIDVEAEARRYAENIDRPWSVERTRPDGHILEVRSNPVPGGGCVLIYSDITERKRAEADIRIARDAAETALRELRAAQANLIQAEKMASLGQLTAGIAHEIKNPLNFVNNFAGLSNELLAELKDIVAPALKTLDDDQRAALDEVVGVLAGNLDKIVEHGRRADGIVKSMLAHSRGGSGDRQAVDLNALIEESLNLAYHGARAQDQNFNIALEREFDPVIKPIELVPQDITRVFLNLFGNSFYAANKRARACADGSFRPVLRVATHDAGDAVEIRVRDNGVGIPADIRDKLFQPFFTTKPTGEGTGLGLSISYDIVTQQHGGAIAVDSQEGVFTEFTVRLPRGGRASQAKGLS
jgi:two-component system, NtrC family, sensor kinase